jgi:uncharacterized protein (DUF58 family)
MTKKILRIARWATLALFLLFVAAAPWGWTYDIAAVLMVGGYLLYNWAGREHGRHEVGSHS